MDLLGGVFRRCNQGKATAGAKKSEFPILKPEERPVGSPNPNPASHDIPPGPTKGSSALIPTPPGIALSEPSQEWPK
jgi:hypothetical protein|nr:hypothetical protein Q903MT_gene6165 [Picea sitchensis]